MAYGDHPDDDELFDGPDEIYVICMSYRLDEDEARDLRESGLV